MNNTDTIRKFINMQFSGSPLGRERKADALAALARLEAEGLPNGHAEWLDENEVYHVWECWLGRMVECPACGFTFDADHTDYGHDGFRRGYSCPACAQVAAEERLLLQAEALSTEIAKRFSYRNGRPLSEEEVVAKIADLYPALAGPPGFPATCPEGG